MHVCPVTFCWNPVENPAAPCGECVAVFGPYLRLSGREASAEELAAMQEKAARQPAPPPVPVQPRRRAQPRRSRRTPRLSNDELAEEAVHLVWWCGIGRAEAARQLGVTPARLETALRRAEAAA